jgi:hypothetical protein
MKRGNCVQISFIDSRVLIFCSRSNEFVRRVVDVDLAAGMKMNVVNKTTATAEKKTRNKPTKNKNNGKPS